MVILSFFLLVSYIAAAVTAINYQSCKTLRDARRHLFAQLAETAVIGAATGTILASAVNGVHWFYWLVFGIGIVLCLIKLVEIHFAMDAVENLDGSPVL